MLTGEGIADPAQPEEAVCTRLAEQGQEGKKNLFDLQKLEFGA